MNYSQLQLITTKDNSKTVGFSDIDEHYHSTHGAVNESIHVYINAGLKEIASQKQDIQILEIGLGTGLNAFLSSFYAEKLSIKLDYIALEPFPLPKEIYMQLNYSEFTEGARPEDFLKLHTCEWNKKIALSPFFIFCKYDEKAETFDYPDNYFDLVYFDAFAPRFQPELWTEEVFSNIYSSMKNDGILTTYCCKGDVKRSLQNVGFRIEKIPGFSGKREMLRARK